MLTLNIILRYNTQYHLCDDNISVQNQIFHFFIKLTKFLIYKLQWTNYNMSALTLSTNCGFIRNYKRKRVSKIAAGNWPRGRSDFGKCGKHDLKWLNKTLNYICQVKYTLFVDKNTYILWFVLLFYDRKLPNVTEGRGSKTCQTADLDQFCTYLTNVSVVSACLVICLVNSSVCLL